MGNGGTPSITQWTWIHYACPCKRKNIGLADCDCQSIKLIGFDSLPLIYSLFITKQMNNQFERGS